MLENGATRHRITLIMAIRQESTEMPDVFEVIS